MFINQNQILGSIIPDVFISKITLETAGSSTKPSTVQELHPHVDLSRQPEKINDPLYGAKNIFLPVRADFSKKSMNQSEKLIISLDLVVKEKLDDGLIGTWFEHQNFKKYIKLKIFQSTKAFVTQAVTQQRKFFPLIDKTKTLVFPRQQKEKILNDFSVAVQLPGQHDKIRKLVDDSIQVRDLSIKDDVVGDKVNLAKHYTEVDANGNTITNFSFRIRFELSNQDPEHLAYFAFSYLDLETMAKDFKMKLDFNLIAEPLGKVVSDIVFDQSLLVDKSFIYLDPDGNIWVGPISGIDTGNFLGQSSDGTTVALTRQEIGNSKVQDFRHFADIEKLVLDFSIIENEILNEKLKNPFKDTLDFSIPEVYFSDLFLARDKFGHARFMFSVDLRKMLENNSAFGKLFNRKQSAQIAITDSSILSMKVFRRRIAGSPEIGSAPNIDNVFDSNQFDEPVAASGEKAYKKFKPVNDANASLKEIENLSIDGTPPKDIRYFTGIDKVMKDVTDGYYVYGLEMEVEDAAFDFLKRQLDTLGTAKNSFEKYFQEATTLSTTIITPAFTSPYIDFPGEKRTDKSEQVIGNFDPTSNRFTQAFIDEQRKKYQNAKTTPWRNAVITYLNILSLFVDDDKFPIEKFEKALFFFVHPASGNPSGILKLLSLMQTLHETLSKTLGLSSTDSGANSLTGQIDSNAFTRRVTLAGHKNHPTIKTFKLKKVFNNIFNSFVPHETGYDFLDIDGSKDNLSGLKFISGEEYSTRVDREVNHYFVRQNNINPNINISVKDQIFTRNDSIETNHFSFLTPARVKLKDRFDMLRIGNSPTPLLQNENLAHLEFSIRLGNTRTAPFKQPNVELKATGISENAQLLRANTLNYFAGLNVVPILLNTKLLIPITSISLENPVPRTPTIVDQIVDDKSICDINVENNINTNHTSLLLAIAKRLEISNLPTPTIAPNLRQVDFNIDRQIKGTPTLDHFDITSPTSKINHLIQNPQLVHSEQFHLGAFHQTTLEDALIRLPMQVKSLFLSKLRPDIIRKNWFAGTTDPLKTAPGATEFTLSYRLINSVQVFIGFDQTSEGGLLIKNPLWVPLTLERYNKSVGQAMLCRLKQYENKLIGISRDKNLDMPVYDEYFFIEPKAKAVLETPVIPKFKPNIITTMIDLQHPRIVEATNFNIPFALQSARESVKLQKEITFNIDPRKESFPVDELLTHAQNPDVTKLTINLPSQTAIPVLISRTNLEAEDTLQMTTKTEFMSNNIVNNGSFGAKSFGAKGTF